MINLKTLITDLKYQYGNPAQADDTVTDTGTNKGADTETVFNYPFFWINSIRIESVF